VCDDHGIIVSSICEYSVSDMWFGYVSVGVVWCEWLVNVCVVRA